MSTYASTLTAPHTIRWADRHSADGTDQNIKITLNAKHYYDYETGKWPYKQAFLYIEGDGNQYQVQVRRRYRNVWGDGDSLNGKYTEWSGWSDSDLNYTNPTKTTNANEWDYANMTAPHKNQPYITLNHEFENGSNNGAVYDRIQYEFRIRQYRHSAVQSERRHGDWAYQVLDTWFCPDMMVGEENEENAGLHCFMAANGDIRLPYQVPWTRNDGEVVFSSIILWHQGEPKELVTEPFKIGTIYGTQTRPGRSMMLIEKKKLHGDIDIGDSISIKSAVFRASSGEEGKVYSLNGPDGPHAIKVKAWANTVDNTPEITFIQTDLMALVVRAHKNPGDSFWWRSAECTITWTAPDGTTRTISQDTSEVEGGYQAECVFYTPPLDTILNVTFTARSEANDNGNTDWGVTKGITIVDSKGNFTFRCNVSTAILKYNNVFNMQYKPFIEVTEMAGREKPVMRSATGGTRSFSVSGEIVRRGKTDKLTRKESWHEIELMSHRTGILRTPGGYRFVCCLTGITYSDSADSATTGIVANFLEVG